MGISENINFSNKEKEKLNELNLFDLQDKLDSFNTLLNSQEAQEIPSEELKKLILLTEFTKGLLNIKKSEEIKTYENMSINELKGINITNIKLKSAVNRIISIKEKGKNFMENIRDFEKNIKDDINSLDPLDICEYLEYIMQQSGYADSFEDILRQRIGIEAMYFLPDILVEASNISNLGQKKYESISNIREALFVTLSINRKIYSSVIKAARLDGQKPFQPFIDNPNLVLNIDEAFVLKNVLDYFVEKGEKLHIKYINPAIKGPLKMGSGTGLSGTSFDGNKSKNSFARFLFEDGVDLGEEQEYLNYFSIDMNLFPETIDRLIKRENGNSRNIQGLIEKMVEIWVSPDKIADAIIRNDLGFVSLYVNSYISKSFSTQYAPKEYKDYFLGDTKYQRMLKSNNYNMSMGLDKFKIYNDSYSSGKKSDIEYIMNLNNNEKDTIGTLLYKNATGKDFTNTIIKLISKGFSSPDFDKIFNQSPEYIKARIEKHGLSSIVKISQTNLNKKTTIDFILGYDKATTYEKVKAIGQVNITSINRILQILKYLEKDSNGDEEKFGDSLTDFWIHSSINYINLITNISRGNQGNDEKIEDEEFYNKMKIILAKGRDKDDISILTLYLTAYKNKKNTNISKERQENIDNSGLLKYIHQEVEKYFNKNLIDEETKNRLLKVIDKNISPNHSLSDKDLLNIYSGIEHDPKLKENQFLACEIIGKGLEGYKRNIISRGHRMQGLFPKLYSHLQQRSNSENNEAFSAEDFISEFKDSIGEHNLRLMSEAERLQTFKDYITKRSGNKSFTPEEWDYLIKEVFSLLTINDGIEYSNNITNGYKGSFSDFLKGKKEEAQKQVEQEQNQQNNIAQEQTTNQIENFDEKTSTYTYESGKGKVQLKLEPEEIALAREGKEKLFTNFYDKLKEVGLESLWSIRKQLFNVISGTDSIGFDSKNGDYLNENEIKTFFNAILKSIGEEEISKADPMKDFIQKIKTLNHVKSDGGTARNMRGESTVEEKFRQRFVPDGNLMGFKRELFEKALKGEEE